MSIGVVVALDRERRALPAALVVARRGLGATRAAAAARELVAAGVDLLVSFGFAGGLDPELGAGALVIASEVRGADDPPRATDAARSRALAAQCSAAGVATLRGPLWTADAVVASPAAKRALAAATGAIAVDMESAAVGRIAAEHRLPFLVLRAISDPANRAVPRTAMAAVRADGRLDWPSLAWHLATRPRDWAGLAALRRGSDAATRALRIAGVALAAHAAGPEPGRDPCCSSA